MKREVYKVTQDGAAFHTAVISGETREFYVIDEWNHGAPHRKLKRDVDKEWAPTKAEAIKSAEGVTERQILRSRATIDGCCRKLEALHRLKESVIV